MQRYYVGVSLTNQIVFRTAVPAGQLGNRANYRRAYNYVIGPFRTKGAAILMSRYASDGNPHLVHVADAERFSKKLGPRWYKRAGYEPNQYLSAMVPIQYLSAMVPTQDSAAATG